MASTITLQNSINWVQPFLRFLPLNIGSNNEPAITSANIVKQIMLGPPFCWRWNRAQATPFNTSQGTQDYARTITDFGFLEKATVKASADKAFEIPALKNILSTNSEQGRPAHIATLLDDNAGSLTFRFIPTPEKAYTVNLLYQKKPTLFTALSDTWTPIPDEYSFVYNQGFLAFSAMYADDQRWQIELLRFLGSLIGVSEGLDETQKDAFLEQWLAMTGQSQAYIQKVGLGLTGRNTAK
jgi:hypothetical protein